MSLLSDTNYTPQRIFALLRLLDAREGQLSFDSIVTWLKPNYRGSDKRSPDDEHINIRQLLGAATSLGLINSPAGRQYRLTCIVPSSLEAFADLVHERLAGLDWDHPDSIVLEAYAAVVVLTEAEQHTTWLEVATKDRAARINGAVRPSAAEDESEANKRFNQTKFSPWQRWMIFLGLGFPLPKGELYPYPAQRLERELARMRRSKALTSSLDIADLLSVIAECMPYLDGGRLFQASAEQVRLPPLERAISRVLSAALRDLHDDKRLLLATIGDAKQTYALTAEPHAVRSIKTVTFEAEPVRV